MLDKNCVIAVNAKRVWCDCYEDKVERGEKLTKQREKKREGDEEKEEKEKEEREEKKEKEKV